MPYVKLNIDCVAAGKPAATGDVVEVSEQDAAMLQSIGRAVSAPAPSTPAAPASTLPETPAPKGRTKAQIAADLAAARAAEEQLQADLAQATS